MIHKVVLYHLITGFTEMIATFYWLNQWYNYEQGPKDQREEHDPNEKTLKKWESEKPEFGKIFGSLLDDVTGLSSGLKITLAVLWTVRAVVVLIWALMLRYWVHKKSMVGIQIWVTVRLILIAVSVPEAVRMGTPFDVAKTVVFGVLSVLEIITLGIVVVYWQVLKENKERRREKAEESEHKHLNHA